MGLGARELRECTSLAENVSLGLSSLAGKRIGSRNSSSPLLPLAAALTHPPPHAMHSHTYKFQIILKLFFFFKENEAFASATDPM